MEMQRYSTTWPTLKSIHKIFILEIVGNRISSRNREIQCIFFQMCQVALILLQNWNLGWPTISHINYWDQLNSWKNFWKFGNCPLCRNRSGPSLFLNVTVYWQISNTKACPKKLSQILAINIENGGRRIGLRIYVRCCLKN